MSIFFDFHVEHNGKKFRRAIDSDKNDIDLFLDKKHTEAVFGQKEIGPLIELATLAICLIEEHGNVIGFMALHDHPNVPCVPAADWENWLQDMFQRKFRPHNTLFLHMMCCAEAFNDVFVDEALSSVFKNDEYLLQIVLIPPPTCTHGELSRYRPFRKHIIKKVPSKRAEDDGIGLYMYVAQRQVFYGSLTVRAAVEEDNDDVVNILDKLHPSMKKLYGDYYVSEMLGRHPESPRKIVVAQRHDKAVGVICLNSDIDYHNLQKTYELAPYFGLRKATSEEKEELKASNSSHMAFGEPILSGKRNPFDDITEFSITDTIQDHYHESSRKKMKAKVRKASSHVMFKRSTAMRRSFDQFLYKKNSDDLSDKVRRLSATTTSPRVSLQLDEDPFDYDIVNIDSNLLTIPELPLHRDSSSMSLDAATKYKSQRRSTILKLKRIKKQAKLLHKTMDEEEEEEYHGEPNAFSIEIYALRDNIEERKGYDLLEAAFEIMKDYDYCLLRLPSHSSPMYLLRHFTLVPHKSKVPNDYALYIAHRSSVFGKITVRKAEIVDIPQIAKLMQNLDGKDTMWIMENSILGNKQHEAYAFVCGTDIVGFGILEPPEQLDFLQAKFNMDSFHMNKYHHAGHGTYTGFANIKTALVYPVFEVHFRFFLREIMRLSGADTLIWLTGYRSKWVIHKANCMAAAMVPLMPRKSEPTYSFVPELRKIENLFKNIMPFSCWFINTKLTSMTRLNVDTRIVVVGASKTAMGFLNNLLFSDASSYLTFTSVTLVSSAGLPYVRHCQPSAETMFPKHRAVTDYFLKSTPYTYYVNVVQGVVVEINKENKYITVSNGQRYYYDKLFLLIGKQFQHPDYLKAVLEKELYKQRGITAPYTRRDDPSLKEPQINTTSDTPRNVFIINTAADAHVALRQVKSSSQKNTDEKIIVYGSSLEAYCCIATLQELNVPSNKIVFVEPFPPENPKKTRIPIFNNVYVDQTISEFFEELGIEVLRSYYFQSWKKDIYNVVTHVTFLSHFQTMELRCNALFYYGTQGIDADAFQAIHKSGLVYDEGILVDHEFRTKDHSIYAAGPTARYFARYFASMRAHKYYDSYEVGEKLGTQIRNQLDPLFFEGKVNCRKTLRNSVRSVSFDSSVDLSFGGQSLETAKESSSSNKSRESNQQSDKVSLPVFTNPIVNHCTMPGGLQYLDVRSPGLKIPHPYVQSLNFTGYVMETFKSGYFKLHLTKDFIVDGITCLSPEKPSIAHFKSLYGKSSILLNNVHIKYTAKKVDNFYEFFNSPGIMFLYHEQLDELMAVVKELVPLGKPDGETLSEALKIAYEKFKKPSAIRSKFEKSPHVEAITSYVLEWVSQNELLLPMYFQPYQHVKFIHDLNHHPAFSHGIRRRKKSVFKLLLNAVIGSK